MSVSTRSNFKKARSKRWVITITTLLMLAMFPVAWLLHKKTNEVKADLAKYNDPFEQIDEEDTGEAKSSLNQSFVVKDLSIKLPGQEKAATIKVYWQAENIYLLIDSLSKLPVGERYEVWSIAGGKRSSLGLFDAPGDDHLIIKAENASMTDNYDIKIVKQGTQPATTGEDK